MTQTMQTAQTPTQGQTTQGAPMIYGAMAKIMAEVGHVKADGYNNFSKYSYKSAEAIKGAVQTACAHNGVTMIPTFGKPEITRETTAKGGAQLHVIMETKLTFYATDGSSVTVTSWGEAADTGDKAVNKAETAGVKYGLINAFLISTPSEEDADNSTVTIGTVQVPVPQNTQGGYTGGQYNGGSYNNGGYYRAG